MIFVASGTEVEGQLMPRGVGERSKTVERTGDAQIRNAQGTKRGFAQTELPRALRRQTQRGLDPRIHKTGHRLPRQVHQRARYGFRGKGAHGVAADADVLLVYFPRERRYALLQLAERTQHERNI